jgi:phosphoglycerate dehydrogenase-like enzyme
MDILLIMLEKNLVSKLDKEEIQGIAGDRRILVTEDEYEALKIAEQVEIAAGWVPRQLLGRFTNLRWFQQWGAGADWLLDHPDLAKQKFILTNMSGLHAIPISEYILAFLLAFARDLPRAVRAQARGEWVPHEQLRIFELAGKTLILVGVGAIGGKTAQVARPLGMRVLGVRKNPEVNVLGVDDMFSPEHLLEILPEGDFVAVTVPLTLETRGMFGEAQLRAMKETAYLINIGRGGTIDEACLIKALDQGWIAGAGLDVFEEEPLSAESPLWRMENVIITAHYSGMTPHYHERGLVISKRI